MNTIFTLLMVLIVIASVLLVIIIMAQNPKGGGLSGTFGGTSSAQFGVQRTNDFMEKSTWTLGITIGLLCLLSVILTANPAQTRPNPANTKPATEKAPATKPAENAKPTTTTTTAPVQQTEPVQQTPATGN